MRRQEMLGSTLVMALLLTTLLLTLGLGLLARKATRYSAARSAEVSGQALLLAQSGLEDTLLKLGKDISFPPPGHREQELFTYSEEVYTADGSSLVGSYRVDIDTSLAGKPSYVLQIWAHGVVGGSPKAEASRRDIYAELDLNPSSPTYFKLINYQDMGAL